ncbi:MBL fold metallo-hydrolase [Kitasatospora nipponensis]|uniref:MBL fold metallo-hydrolase n=1 Tax=Kitasatospora nipponensis TaxID=258049 RepID=A0ABN1WCE0_9ACTN
MTRLTVTYLGGPTALLELGGLRLLTDPTFDDPGEYPIGNRVLVKTAGSALGAEQLGPVDAVLLSHDQHPDNLDRAGRAYLDTAPTVLSTASAEQRLPAAAVRALANWSSVELPRPDGGVLRVTGVPAQHGPDGTEHLVGEVTGFLLAGAGLPTVYVSGDNASLAVVRTIADRLGPVDVALLFAGAARTPLVDGPLTLTSEEAAQAALLLGAARVVPLHFEQWGHFTEGAPSLRQAFERAGLAERLRLPGPGERIEFTGFTGS